MDVPSREFVLAGSLEELKAKGRFVLHGSHRPILVVYDRGASSPSTIVARPPLPAAVVSRRIGCVFQ